MATSERTKQRTQPPASLVQFTYSSERDAGLKRVGSAESCAQRLVVEYIDFDQVRDIDIIRQTFSARFVVFMRFVGGAKDEHLSAEGDSGE